jgi:hypothetical protein
MSWASTPWPRQQRLSYIAQPGTTDREPTTAIADWWSTLPMALAAEECDHLIATAKTVEPVASGNGDYYLLDDVLDPDLLAALVSRLQTANQQWWNLDTDTFYVAVKRYREGEEHSAHIDWVPSHSACRKVVGGWQLTPPDGYAGGDVVITYGPHKLTVPRDQGTCFVMPCWTTHEVQQVTAGERWSLIVNGFGPPLR